jgi:hypothetical protein
MGSRFQSGVARHWNGPVPGDRRRSCRYLALHVDCHLGWWKDATFEHKPAALIDISMHGAMLSMKAKPGVELGKPVWYRPVGIANDEWIEAVLVSMNKPWLGNCSLRINFSSSFGYETFKAIVYGTPTKASPASRALPEHENEQFWK